MPSGKTPKATKQFIEARKTTHVKAKRQVHTFVISKKPTEVAINVKETLESKKSFHTPPNLLHAIYPEKAKLSPLNNIIRTFTIEKSSAFVVDLLPCLSTAAMHILIQPSIYHDFLKWRETIWHSNDQECCTTFQDRFKFKKEVINHKFQAWREWNDHGAGLEKYFIIPYDQATLDSMEQILRKAGLDRLVNGIREHTGDKSLCIYSLGFLLVGPSKSWPQIHTDGTADHQRCFHCLLPLKILDGSAEEILLRTTNSSDILYKYESKKCIVFPCDLQHQTCHQEGEWQYPDNLRIMLSVDVGPLPLDVNDKLLDTGIDYCYPHFPSSTVLLSDDGATDRSKAWKEALYKKNK